MALTTIQVYRVTTRPNLFMGGDREMVMFTGIIAAALVFGIQTLSTIPIGVLFWMFNVFCLRLMAKYDPLLRQIYLKDIRYEKYYAADTPIGYVNSKFQETFYKNPDTIYH